MVAGNGTTKRKAQAFQQRRLSHYRPGLGAIGGFNGYHPAVREGHFTWFDVPAMDRDPQVRFGYSILCAPIYTATWGVKATDKRVAAFVQRSLKRFWSRDIDKALLCLKWGTAVGELLYRFEESTGLLEYDGLDDVLVQDVRALAVGREVMGFKWRDQVIGPGKAFWCAHEPDIGRVHGRSRYEGCWSPWMEKRGEHGAIGVRRLWFFKNAIRGGLMKYPDQGEIPLEGGDSMNPQDYAMQLVEKAESGAVMAIPSTVDGEGRPLWDYVPAGTNGSAADFLQYPKELDMEILKGMNIQPEVAQAMETGSGWSGRSVPFLVYLKGEDRIVSTILSAFDRCFLKHAVEANFGERARYEIEAVSLVPKEDAEGGEEAAGGGNPLALLGANLGGKGGPPVRMSANVEDRPVLRLSPPTVTDQVLDILLAG